MAASITILSTPSAVFNFNLRVKDWNGDEWPLSRGDVAVTGSGITASPSTDAIGSANVGIVALQVANSNRGTPQRLTVSVVGQTVATIDLIQHTASSILSSGAVVSSGGTVDVYLDRRSIVPTYLVKAGARTAGLVTPITAFQASHGFVLYTSSGASPFGNLNDTTSPLLGTQHAWAGSAGGVSAGFAGIQRIGGSPIDMTGKTLRVTFKIVNRANLQEFGIFLGTGALTSYCRIYAHSNQSQWLYREGEIVTIDYPIGLRTFAAAADYNVTGAPIMTAITDIRLRVQDGAAGASMGSVEIHLYELALVATQTRGKILFAFDDEDLTVFTEAFLRMKARNMVGHVFTIASAIGVSGKMTEAQIATLHREGWDICCHAFADATHDARTITLHERDVEADMISVKTWCRERGYRGEYYYASPGGDYDNGTVSRLDLIRKHFKIHRGINTRQSETNPISDPHKLRTIYVTSSTTAQLVKDRIDCAMLDSKGIAVLTFHRLVAGTPGINTEYQISNFEAILDHIVAQGYDVTTLSALEADGVF